MVPLSAEHRKAAGLRAGDTIDIDIEIDAGHNLQFCAPRRLP